MTRWCCIIFVALTSPAGLTVYVNPEAVVTVGPNISCGVDSAHSEILTQNGRICVAEDPWDVAQKIMDAKGANK
jgi:hypothetical protein